MPEERARPYPDRVEPQTERVVLTVRDGVAEVRLTRPDKHNALDEPMFAAIIAVGRAVAADPAVRAVVLSGEGPSFCSGLDLARLRGLADGELPRRGAVGEPVGAARARGQQAAHVWATAPVPVIAALHGAVFGGGLQIALGADLRIAAPDARLSVREIHWGLVPDMTGTAVLPDLVGRDVAKELTFTGRVVDGAEAAALGLVTHTDPDPHAAALALAAEIACRNPDAVRAAKRLLDTSGRVPLAEQLAAEQDELTGLVGSPNQQEAVRAALQGRPAVFADPT